MLEGRIRVIVSFSYWLACQASFQIIWHLPTQLIVFWLFPLVGVGLICFLLLSGYSIGWLAIVAVVLCFLFDPFVILITVFLVRRSNPLAKGPFEFIFDSEGIHISGEAFSTSLQWPVFRRVIESKNFIFLFFSPRQAQCLPIAQLQAAGVLEDIRNLVKKYVNKAK